MSDSINWLHLSDFHCGQKDGDWTRRIADEFCAGFPEIISKRSLPYPDLILVTGDLAFSGEQDQYDVFESTLRQIVESLPGWSPTVITVPGNHDSNWAKVVTGKGNASSFAEYWNYWCQRSCVCWETCRDVNVNKCLLHCDERRLGIACSSYPGDFYLEINLPGKFPFAIIGMNSELREDGRTDADISLRRLNVLKEATKANNLFPRNTARKLLLLHHPPSIFKEQERIFHDIKTEFGTVDICLHGHQHESRSTVRIISGKAEYQYQVASLCGLEHFGTIAEKRSFGFTIGSISRHGEIRIWPFVREMVNGEDRFAWDRKLGEEYRPDETGYKKPGILLRKAAHPPFDYRQMLKGSTKITVVGLFHRSPLIPDAAGGFFDYLNSISVRQRSEMDITFILPARSTLKDYSSVFKMPQAEIETHWDTLIRKIGHFFDRHPEIKGSCLEHKEVYPIEAIVFDGEYIVHRVLGLPNESTMQSDWSDESFGQLIRAVELIKVASSPTMEFNVFGQVVDNVFRFEGIVPHLMTERPFSPIRGKTFPVAICILIYDGDLILQTRTDVNSGRDFGKLSLVANKLIEADFFEGLTSEQTSQFWAEAAVSWRQLDQPNERAFVDISGTFSRLLGLKSPRIAGELFLRASARAMKRCLYSELNLQVADDRLKVAPQGYSRLIEKGGFSILVTLFCLELTAEEFNKCTLHDSDLKKVEIDNLESYSAKLNAFISSNLPQVRQIVSGYHRK
jgi:calcineurin-like phosphoesterase family protein